MEIVLVKSGKAEFCIAIPDNATKTEQTAANEMRQYIQKSSGAEAKIVPESEAYGTTVYVGHTNYAGSRGIKADSKENWIIKADCGNLVLTGGICASDRGVIYSVYHFLEDYLGVHWWNFAEEFVPEIKDFSVNGDISISKTPFASYRKVVDLDVYPDFATQARNRMNMLSDDGLADGAFSDDIKAYGGAMYMGPPHQCHTIPKYFPADEHFDEHPEWWAYNEVFGKRIVFGQMCLCDEGFYAAMREKLFENIKEQEAKCEATNTEKPYFYSVTFADTQNLCECPMCKKSVAESGKSGYLLKFVNRLARDVKKKYSNVYLETLAYSRYIEPPLDDTAPESNVIIRYADIRQDMLHDLNYPTNADSLRRIKEWSELCRKNGSQFFIWDYLLHLFPCGPMPQAFRLITNMKISCEHGASGFFLENENHNPRDFWALDQWIIHRMMEDPACDGEELINTFMRDYYGKAGAYVRQYLDLAHEKADATPFVVMLDEPLSNWGYADADFVRRGDEILRKAMKAVQGDEVLTRRVRIVMSGLYVTMASRWYDFERMNEKIPGYTRDEAIELAIDGIRAFSEAYGRTPVGNIENSELIHIAKRYENILTAMKDATNGGCPLPPGLEGTDSNNIVDICVKDIVRFMDGERGDSIEDDPDSLTGKVMKISLDKMAEGYRSRYIVSSKDAPVPKPLSFFVKKKNDINDGCFECTDLYREDLTPGKYQLIKVEGITSVTEDINRMFYIINNRDLAVNLSEIRKVMPFEKCDVYVSMKATGKEFGSGTDEENALWLERVIVVKTG